MRSTLTYFKKNAGVVIMNNLKLKLYFIIILIEQSVPVFYSS